MFRILTAACSCAMIAGGVALVAGETGPAKPASTASAKTARQLDQAVHDALRREAAAKDADKQAAARKLLVLYRQLDASPKLSASKRRELQELVGRRLLRTSASLKRRLKTDSPSGPETVATADRELLAQQLPGVRRGQGGPQAAPGAAGAGGNSLGAATAQQAQQLVDLIESTVMPSSWQTNGGTGAIKYFAAGMVLVISATDQVHEQVGGVLGDLRK